MSAERVAKTAHRPTVDRIPMDERHRWLIKIVMLMRVDMRELFGMEVANRWGFWVDRYLSKQVRDFADWIEYPKGDRQLDGDKDGVWAAVVSKDGYFLFTADICGMLKVWNMLDYQIIREWKAHKQAVPSLAFQSGLLVSGSRDSFIKIWDTHRDYQLIHTLEGHTHWVSSLDINNKATSIISCSRDKSIRIWSVKTGECIRVMMGHYQLVSTMLFIGNLILSAANRSLKVWNPSDGTEIQSVEKRINGSIYDLSINCNASIVACAFDGGLSLFSWPELEFIRKVNADPSECTFHPIHPTILAGSDVNNYSIHIFDLTKDDSIIHAFEGHSDDIDQLCFTPDGTRLVSVSNDASVRFWDVFDL